jgi:hypothetical protein
MIVSRDDAVKKIKQTRKEMEQFYMPSSSSSSAVPGSSSLSASSVELQPQQGELHHSTTPGLLKPFALRHDFSSKQSCVTDLPRENVAAIREAVGCRS